jgi:hypothetical protein
VVTLHPKNFDLGVAFEPSVLFRRSVAESLDTNAAWQTTFGRSPHEIWCEEGPTARVLTL